MFYKVCVVLSILPFITDDVILNRLVKYAEVDLTNLNE